MWRFDVTGPVRAWRDGVEVSLGPPQQRAVLAVLLLRRGRPVTVEELIDALWGQEPPSGAVSVVRTYISRLRAVLEPGRAPRRPPSVLLTVSSAYVLRVDADAVDAVLLESRLERARALLAAGAAGEARRLVASAVTRWTGPPLDGVPGPFAETERYRLREMRISASETDVDAALALGLHRDVLPELLRLTSRYPLREHFRLQLMLALHRCGRRGEALAVYDDTRRVLNEELGLEPGPALRGQHRRILADDTGSPTVRYGTARPCPRPEQLPLWPADSTGRETELARLVRTLTSPESSTVTVVLSGMAGVGKSTLAGQAAQAVGDRFPDGRLYADLSGGADGPRGATAVLETFLRVLGDPGAAYRDGRSGSVPAGHARDAEDLSARLRTLLAGRRVLVFLDNACDTAQVRPLLADVPGCATIVTSRSRLPGLSAGTRMVLQTLRPDAAGALLRNMTGDGQREESPQAVRETAELCGGLPLALRVVAARLIARPNWSVRDIAHMLRDERHRLGVLAAEGLSVEDRFREQYACLAAGQARTLRLLSLALPAGERRAGRAAFVELTDAAALCAEPADVVRSRLEAMVDAGLLDTVGRGHFQLHGLLALFAHARVLEEEPAHERHRALVRLHRARTAGPGAWSTLPV